MKSEIQITPRSPWVAVAVCMPPEIGLRSP